jgi:DNA-binding GntR family transcriptional regulator
MNANAGQADLAYDRIKRAILAGEFIPSQLLSENQLADFCGMSRTPIREAVQRLEMENFLARTDRGLVVPDPSPDEIYEIYETRAILEVACARLAAERRTELDLANLKRLVESARAITRDDVPELIAANTEVVTAFWRASHNRSLAETLERFGLPSVRFGGESTLSVPGQWERILKYHAAAYDAVLARDADRAAEVVLQQAETVRDMRLELWRTRHRQTAAVD